MSTRRACWRSYPFGETSLSSSSVVFASTSLGLAWLQGSQPQAEDFVRLKQVPFRHALCGHGEPARDAMDGYHAAFNRFFQV